MGRLALDHFVDKLFQNLSKMQKYLFEIDVGGVRMDSYGSVRTRMGPYGPWGLPGGLPGASWGPGGPRKGGKGGSPPGGARGALLGGLPISLRGILTYMPFRAAYGYACPAVATQLYEEISWKDTTFGEQHFVSVRVPSSGLRIPQGNSSPRPYKGHNIRAA